MPVNGVASADWDAEGFVLAGGQSSRMGTEKALVSFRGEPLVVHALRILREAGLRVSIAGARASLGDFAPVVPDREPDLGPLSGICAAMASMSARRAVFVPVDLPLLPASLIAFLLREACNESSAAVVPEVNGFKHPFPAVLDRDMLPALRSELEAGRRGCFAAFQVAANGLGRVVKAVSIEQAISSGRLVNTDGIGADPLEIASWFLNLNKPEDLIMAQFSKPAIS